MNDFTSLILGTFLFLAGAIVEDIPVMLIGSTLLVCWHVDQRIMTVTVNLESGKVAGMVAAHLNASIDKARKERKKK